MSIAKETADRDKLLDLAAETIQKLNRNVEDIGENIKNSRNPSLKKHSLLTLYEDFCKKGDCKDIDNMNSLLQYLEESYETAKNKEVKNRIRNAIYQVKETLNIKY